VGALAETASFAKRAVTEILTDSRWPTIDIGEIEGARLLEP
jgi:hypothetical protein